MNFIACGINYKTAPLAVREQVVFSPETTSDILQALLNSGAASEAMLLSTCNRTELYLHADQAYLLAHWLAQYPEIAPVVHSLHWYWHYGQKAVGHIMRVASGLDSMVIGEPQILGQIKQAFKLAQQAGTVGSQLHRLIQRVFAVTKQVRTDTRIGTCPISVAYAGVSTAKRIFADFSKCQVLLIGGGQIIELVALHLKDLGVQHLTVANRSVSKAQRIAERFNGQAICLPDIPEYLQKTDIVVTGTASPSPIIDKEMVECAFQQGERRSLLMIDLAVPRDIDPEVASIKDVYLYDMDSLQEIITEGLKLRRESMRSAEQIIEVHADCFMRQTQALSAVDTIRAYREKLERLRDQELLKAKRRLQRGADPSEVVHDMARILTNKIMHTPTTQLKQAAFEGQAEALLLARNLFEL